MKVYACWMDAIRGWMDEIRGLPDIVCADLEACERWGRTRLEENDRDPNGELVQLAANYYCYTSADGCEIYIYEYEVLQ